LRDQFQGQAVADRNAGKLLDHGLIRPAGQLGNVAAGQDDLVLQFDVEDPLARTITCWGPQTEPSPNFSFNDTEEKIDLGIGFSQVEGITHSDANTYYISSERYQNNFPPITLPSQLYEFNTNDTIPENEELPIEIPSDLGKSDNALIIYRMFGSQELQYDLNSNVPLFGRSIFDITGKRVRHTPGNLIENNSIDLSGLGSAVYYLTFYLQGETISKPFILN